MLSIYGKIFQTFLEYGNTQNNITITNTKKLSYSNNVVISILQQLFFIQ